MYRNTQKPSFTRLYFTRKDCNIISEFLVSYFISDHRALHASLQCIRPHPVRKQISVRAIRRIKDDAIVKDLDKFSIDQRCVDVDTMVEMYERFLSELLDKHAPLKKITVVDIPLNCPLNSYLSVERISG